MKQHLLAILLLVTVSACSQGTEELYAREAALPSHCRTDNPMTLTQAQRAADRLVLGVPTTLRVSRVADDLAARRDRVTGTYTVTLVEGRISGMWVAHELAHVAVFDAYANKAPPGEPSNEGYVKIHGDEFVRTYKGFLKELVGKECADAL